MSPNMLTVSINDPGPILDTDPNSPTFGVLIVDPYGELVGGDANCVTSLYDYELEMTYLFDLENDDGRLSGTTSADIFGWFQFDFDAEGSLNPDDGTLHVAGDRDPDRARRMGPHVRTRAARAVGRAELGGPVPRSRGDGRVPRGREVLMPRHVDDARAIRFRDGLRVVCRTGVADNDFIPDRADAR